MRQCLSANLLRYCALLGLESDYQRRLSRRGPDPPSAFGRASETRMLRPSSGCSLSWLMACWAAASSVIYKGKALGAAGLAVHDQSYGLDLADGGEGLADMILGGVVAQVADVQFLSHCFLLLIG